MNLAVELDESKKKELIRFLEVHTVMNRESVIHQDSKLENLDDDSYSNKDRFMAYGAMKAYESVLDMVRAFGW